MWQTTTDDTAQQGGFHGFLHQVPKADILSERGCGDSSVNQLVESLFHRLVCGISEDRPAHLLQFGFQATVNQGFPTAPSDQIKNRQFLNRSDGGTFSTTPKDFGKNGCLNCIAESSDLGGGVIQNSGNLTLVQITPHRLPLHP